VRNKSRRLRGLRLKVALSVSGFTVLTSICGLTALPPAGCVAGNPNRNIQILRLVAT
jgi:hypothetical protein